jgi:hypothetical protein
MNASTCEALSEDEVNYKAGKFGKKLPRWWHNLRYYRSIRLEGLKKTSKVQLEEPVSKPRLELDTYRIRIRYVTASTNLRSDMTSKLLWRQDMFYCRMSFFISIEIVNLKRPIFFVASSGTTILTSLMGVEGGSCI